MDSIIMFDGQRLPFAISPTNAQGKPAKIQDGSLTVVFADEDATQALGLNASINPDGTSGFIHSPADGLSGKTIATLSGDADVGDGVETISQSVEIEIQHRKAANLGATFGAPEDEPTP